MQGVVVTGARTRGISLIHGNHAAFSSDVDPLFSHVFQFFYGYDITKNNLVDAGDNLKNVLLKTSIANRSDKTTDCSAIHGIEDMMVQRIRVVTVEKEKK